MPAVAQTPFVLGTSLNLTGGASNRIRAIASQQGGSAVSKTFYGIYPSLSLTSMRPQSSLSAKYAFGFNRTIGDTTPPPGTHTAGLSFGTKVGPLWDISLSDSFSVTDALGTVNSLSGTAAAAAGSSPFAFTSASARASIYNNGFNANIRRALDANSGVSFTANHSIRKYGGGVAANTLVSDQQQFSGALTFTQQLGAAESLSFSYRGTVSEYGTFGRSIAHSGEGDYSVQIGSSTTLKIGVGVTQVNRGTVGKLSYDAIASLAKTWQSSLISLNYSQNSTDQVGVGSTATTQRGTVAWSRTFGTLTTNASASAYQSKATLNNPVDAKGFEAVSNLGIPITSKLVLSGVGTYQRNQGNGALGFSQTRIIATADIGYAITTTLTFSGGASYQDVTQTNSPHFTLKRAFISLRYTQPNLLRVN